MRYRSADFRSAVSQNCIVSDNVSDNETFMERSPIFSNGTRDNATAPGEAIPPLFHIGRIHPTATDDNG